MALVSSDTLQKNIPIQVRHLTRNIGLAFVLVVGLAACATGPKNPMTAEQIKSLDIEVVAVSVLAGTPISWGDGEAAFAASKGCEKPDSDAAGAGDSYNMAAAEKPKNGCDYDALVESPEAIAFMNARIVSILDKAFRDQVQPAFQGTAPARVEVEVTHLHIVSGGQAVLIGGNHILRATLNVVDLATGKTIASNPEMFSIAGYGAGGFLSLIIEATSNDPVERLSAGYAVAAQKWIKAEK